MSHIIIFMYLAFNLDLTTCLTPSDSFLPILQIGAITAVGLVCNRNKFQYSWKKFVLLYCIVHCTALLYHIVQYTEYCSVLFTVLNTLPYCSFNWTVLNCSHCTEHWTQYFIINCTEHFIILFTVLNTVPYCSLNRTLYCKI